MAAQQPVATGPEEPEHPDLRSEQAYLDYAYACLAAMRIKPADPTAYAAAQAPGDWNATVALAHLEQRLHSLDPSGGVLCFGRLDEESGDTVYIGRRHVESDSGDAVVVDWRAPVSIPFYRATFSDP